MKHMIALAALLCATPAMADVSLDVTTVSKHLGSTPVKLNESNYGVGIKVGTTKLYGTFGTFRNSFDLDSRYVAVGREFEGRDGWKRLRFGLAVGLVDGYAGTKGQTGTQVGEAQVFFLPYVEFGSERVATRFGLLGQTLTLQLTVKVLGVRQ